MELDFFVVLIGVMMILGEERPLLEMGTLFMSQWAKF